MASIITEIIPTGAYELIRDRIAQILQDELPNQATLSGDANLNATVFVERFISLSNTETPCVNISLANGDYTDQTQISKPGVYQFHIDIYEKSKSIGSVRGDFLASQKLQKLTNVCRGILSHHRYKTLAFEKGFISSRKINDINIAVPQNETESANLTWSRMVFEVKARDLIDGIIPPNIDGFVTRAVMGGTDKGYLYGGDAPEPPVEPICADVTMDFNGTSISSTESGGNKQIIIQTDDAVPVQTGTVLIDTPVELRIEVASVVPILRTYMRPVPTGQLVSYASGDDGDRASSGHDPSTQPLQGKNTWINPQKKWLLLVPNIHGHLFKTTGKTGGYWDPVLAGYFDVNGNPTTRALAFPDNYQVNHSTGLGSLIVSNGANVSWTTALAEIASLTVSGFSDYFLPNVNELLSEIDDSYITPFGQGAFPVANTPFDQTTNAFKWSSTTWGTLTDRAHVVTNSGYKTPQSKTLLHRYIPFRYHFNNIA